MQTALPVMGALSHCQLPHTDGTDGSGMQTQPVMKRPDKQWDRRETIAPCEPLAMQLSK